MKSTELLRTELYDGDVLLRDAPAPYFDRGDEVRYDDQTYYVAKVQFVYSSATDEFVQCVLLAKRPKSW